MIQQHLSTLLSASIVILLVACGAACLVEAIGNRARSSNHESLK